MPYTDSFLIGLQSFFIWAKWLLLLALALTIADLRFGISAARRRKELVKWSRAIRRTFNKITSYAIWIILAYTFGQAFGMPFGIDLLPLIMLLVIYGVELESIYANYFASRGKNLKINVLKFFSKKTDIIEIEEGTTKNDQSKENQENTPKDETL